VDATILGLVLDSSILIAAERRKLTASEAIANVQIAVVHSQVSVAETGHGIYRANTPEIRSNSKCPVGGSLLL
jgi:hypothetical protein